VAAQLTRRGFTQCIGGHRADHRSGVAEVGQRNRDIGFCTANADVEARTLQEAFAARGRQPQQEFSKTYDPLLHRPLSLFAALAHRSMRCPIPFARVLTSGVITAGRATLASISGNKQHNFGT
jgi:hypothetical protein